MPADWIVAHDPKRFNLLHEITRYHGAYSSAKPESESQPNHELIPLRPQLLRRLP